MLFTSQYFSIGTQVNSACSTQRFVFSLSENNRQAAFLCTEKADNLLVQCALPGNGADNSAWARNSQVECLAQNHFSMKNARKQLGEIASTDPTQIKPGPIIADDSNFFPLFENQIFYEKPIARQPESPDEESFRSWLKTNTPRHKASPALLERVSSIIHDNNE